MVEYIITYTGHKVFPIKINPEQIFIEDIAHALSNICRYTGHCREFYSVAQHSVYCALFSRNFPLWGLLHDASEAYICDIASPVKHQKCMKYYRQAERNIMDAITRKFNLPTEEPKEVKFMDRLLLSTEAECLGLRERTDDSWGPSIQDLIIVPWAPKDAEKRFLTMYHSLTNLMGV